MTILNKYANLPDVDMDSPETFENHVSSLPAPDSIVESTSDNVETASLNVKAATANFIEKEKMNKSSFIWNSESKAQKLHFLSLQLFNLREQLEEITKEKDDGKDSFLSQMRALESDIQYAISNAVHAKNDSWNVVQGLSTMRDSIPSEPSKTDGPLVVELYSKPQKVTDSEQFIDLESRVSELEKIIGASLHQPHTNLGAFDIVNTLRKLNSRISLLTDTAFHDQAVKRLESLKLDLDYKTDDRRDRLDSFNDLLNSEYLPLIPQILSRLVTLKETHDHSIHIVQRFKELEQTVEEDHILVSDIQKEIGTFEKIVQENSKDVGLHVSTIIDRVKKMEERIEKLKFREK